MWEGRSILHFSFLLHQWGSRWSLWTFHFCPIILVSTNIIQKLNWVQKYPVLPLLCWNYTCVMLLWQQHRVCVCVCTMVQIVFCSSSVPAGCSALTTYQCVVSPGALCLGWPGFGTPHHHPATVARKPKKQLHQHTLYESLFLRTQGHNQSNLFFCSQFHCWLISSVSLRPLNFNCTCTGQRCSVISGHIIRQWLTAGWEEGPTGK